jgi:hypothetical protein
MPATEWATTAQTKFLHEFLEPYIKAKANQDAVPLTRFWNRLENAFFTEFPAEEVLEHPLPVEGVPQPPLDSSGRGPGRRCDGADQRGKLVCSLLMRCIH